MDRRSWPWKKKSSDKTSSEKAAATISDSANASNELTGSQGDQANHESYKKPKYVQISVESYSHLTGLEDQVKYYEEQVKTFEEEVKELNEKLTAAQTEMTNKENLVKQHAKVAEEAVSGWEKAESEALALKNHLESVTLLKLTAEDRASHLDGALKECMRQIRNLKEEHEQKLHEVVLTKTKQFDKLKLELESSIANLDQELLRSAAENAALSRSLQERSNMLMKLTDEKSQAEAQIELLKSNIESCQKEINSLKYELHIVAKELEIRNEEKNMSVRSAEVANKQHLEGVKKIAKLEAECQRLRGLVRKKLPGPAALAQMKLEVESLGRDHGETRLRKSPGKPSSPHLNPLPEFSYDNIQKHQKENELLTERLLAMEEETKMLKEALAKRNSELQASRSICAKTASKLQMLEAQLQTNGERPGPPKLKNLTEVSPSQNESHAPSFTSMSEDGIEDDASCAGSWATALMSELSQFRKEKNTDSPRKSESASHLDLMDDFLEMEKLANQSNGSNTALCKSSTLDTANSETGNLISSEVPYTSEAQLDEHHKPDQAENQTSAEVEASGSKSEPPNNNLLLELKSRIASVLSTSSDDADTNQVLENIRRTVLDFHADLHHQLATCIAEETSCSNAIPDPEPCPESGEFTLEKETCLVEGSNLSGKVTQIVSQELAAAIAQIHEFVKLLGKEAKSVQGTTLDEDGLRQRIENFASSYCEVMSNDIDLIKFVLDLSRVLSRASELHLNLMGYKHCEAESGNSDCIDKVALPENKDFLKSGENYTNGSVHFSDSTSDCDIPHEGTLVPTSESAPSSWKCSMEEFEQLKLERDCSVSDLARCSENLENTKAQLQETEQLLAEVKSQLTSAQKSNSLSETQLKCMAESYKSLENRADELQTEVNLLRAKTESLDNELQEEKKSHHDSLARCKDFQEQLQRIQAESDSKASQERELTSAAEKLAECQETIFLLGKQLKSLRPQAESMSSPVTERTQKGDGFHGDSTISGTNMQDIEQPVIDTAASLDFSKAGSESPLEQFNAPYSPSDSEGNNLLKSPVSSKHPKHRPTKSGSSSSSSSAPTPEKHPRGFTRFFSSKGKNGN